MKNIFLIIATILMTQIGFAQEVGTTGSKVTAQEAKEFLKHHNMARNELGVSDLLWDVEIAAIAQKYAEELAADNCAFRHSQDDRYGENLWGGSGAKFTAVDASIGWYKEKPDYTYSKITMANASHYTQMIWKKTTSVGVGVSICEDGSYIIVANYGPRGNTLGQHPY